MGHYKSGISSEFITKLLKTKKMKRKILLLSFLFLNTICSYSQIAFYDAVELSGYVDVSTTPHTFRGDAASLKNVSKILLKYCPNLPATTDYHNVISAIITNNAANVNYNPIIAAYFTNVVVPAGGASDNISIKSLFSSVGNLDVTNFADGLAKFLVQRSKEELNVAFFRKFQEFLRAYPEVKIIFPDTYNFLQNIYSYQYAAMLPALKAGFQKDMNAFSTNLIKLRDLTATDCPATNAACNSRITTLNTFLNNDPLGKTFVGALIVSDNLMKGNNAAEILDAIANDKICQGQTDNFSNIIRFSNLISGSLRSTEEGEIWISKTKLNQLFNDDALKIYLGLLYAQDKTQPVGISFTLPNGSSLTLQQILVQSSTIAGNLTAFKNSLKNVGYATADISSAAKNISSLKSEDSQPAVFRYADYASSISTFLKFSVSFFNGQNAKLAADVRLFTSIIDDAVNSCYDIKSQNYSALVLHTSNMLETILNGNYPFKDNYIKYGTFMANIIEAKSSDEVKAAIEAAVLPVGSSSIKRETSFNISLNAFIGPMAGGEYLPKLEDKRWAFVSGFTAPVGVAFSWGNIGNGKRDNPPTIKKRKNGKEIGGKSFSIFVPLIDIGSMATFRFSDDSSDVASEVKLKNIISPGLYFYYGFGKCPISIGIGGQLGPQLREVSAKEINVDKNYYIRFGLNIVVDIPFFNFYTNSK
jgi:hypothetical protein